MIDRLHKQSRLGIPAVAAVAALGFSASAAAIDYQVHGYAAQGFVLSDDNNFFGDSTDGSFDYYEAGINAAVQVRPNLLFAAQAAIRDAGISDDGSARIDYALAGLSPGGGRDDAGRRASWQSQKHSGLL